MHVAAIDFLGSLPSPLSTCHRARAPVGLAILRAACRTCTLCCGSDALVQPLRERREKLVFGGGKN